MFAPALVLAMALPFAQDTPATHTLVVQVGGAHMPAAGLMVGLACGDDVVRFAPTDARGRVTFAGLPPAFAYEAFVPGVRDRGATATSFEVARRGQRELPVLALQLAKGCALRVVVVDAEGKPVADAQVESNGGSQTGRPSGAPMRAASCACPCTRRRGSSGRGRAGACRRSSWTRTCARTGRPRSASRWAAGRAP